MPSSFHVNDEKRFLRFASPLPGKLILTHFSGHEKLSCLFEYHLELLSEDGKIQFKDIVGAAVTVSMELPDEKQRYFHGHLTEFRYVGIKDKYYRYQATMRPWLWFLSRTADCRIFQNKKVIDIIKEVFSDNGMSDFEIKLSSSYRQWDYCVQYRETDLNFVSRLMEQEGIYYYFKHEEDKHKLVLGDGIGAHGTFPGYATIKFFPPTDSGIREEDHVHDWMMGREVIPEKVVLDDYNFEKPKVDLESIKKESFDHTHTGGDHEIYDYPGEYPEKSDGESYARNRMAELYTRHERARGIGNAKGVAAGYLFTLDDFEREDQNKEYLVLSVSHDISSDAATTTGASAEDISYQCQFEVMDKGTQYRSPRITPKPIVQGPQTAVVTGGKEGEIYCDKYGRIKVQFHWDRLGQHDQNSSCWVRIANAWAGKNWGSIHIPRTGHEVIVSFLEGDPDRPLVTGSVYNADNMPPYELEANKTQSGFKSRTHLGNPDNFNEIRFEDDDGKEEMRFQAERDMNTGVKHIRKTYIGASLDEAGVGSRHTECPPIGKMNEQLTVFADRETFIKGNDTLMIAEESQASKGRCMTVFNGNHELTVKTGDQLTTIDTGNKTTMIKTGNQTTEVKMGNFSLKVSMGKITMEAMQAIELKVGGSTLKMDPASITLKSTMVTVEGSAMAKVKGSMVEVNGSAMTMVKGGMVMIN